MYDPVVILRLYSSVLHKHKREYDVNEADIRTAIQNMKEVYKPNPGSLANPTVSVADYNDAAHRCAYLHKYAPFHTALVADMLGRALQQDLNAFQDLIYASGPMNICSLGGGPGSDIFGVLSVLNATFGFFPVSATVIDCMENWRDLFYELINELRYGNYGALGECVGGQYFDWKYLQHNLLAKMTNQVNTAIARANLVTMIKFVSASSCKDTSAMIKKIFTCMKPGALVVYIDNAGGGFHKLVTKEAEDCKFKSVFYLNHETFIEPDLRIKKFGYMPCCESRVSFHIWRKASLEKRNCSVPNYTFKEQDFPPLQTNTILSPKKYENQLDNESFVHNTRISVSSSSASSFPKFIDADDTEFFQETLCSKYSTNAVYGFSEVNLRIHENSPSNSSESHNETYSREISAEESIQYGFAWDASNKKWLDFVSKRNTNATSVKNVKTSEKLLCKTSETQRKPYPKEILAEESIQLEIAKNTFTNCTDFAISQLHSKHPADASNLNTVTFECSRVKPFEIQKATNRRQIAVSESFPNRDSSASLSWWDYIRGLFYQELIGIIAEEFISLYQEPPVQSLQQMYTIGATIAERFQFYLFENMI
ncbi:uncharacterized protein LOC129971113 isoform X1 [Argiope bruennichi]|uniref:uncharacterized protein LOC129971113 isoform X1 n=1 Tax=Argiope bruennichi TaxID=94029 RepID=UPI0024943965|nr:uncharacterized protein LOC129971113 isoform X1 [Argiope bruennichi]